MKNLYLITLSLFASTFAFSQNVGINSTGAAPNASAMLDVSSTNKGLLIPRVALTAANSNAPIGASIVTSLLVYNTATAGTGANAVSPGYYYWDGAKWVSTSGTDWKITGNTGTTAGTHFLGTTDNVSLDFRTNNTIRMSLFNGGYQLRAAGNGTAALPFYSWNSDLDIGMYRISTNTLGFSTGGSERMRIQSTGQIGVNGTAGTPDFFSVTSDNTNNYAINGYCSSAPLGGGIYGYSSNTGNTKAAVWGDINSTNASASAVLGQYLQSSGSGNGVYGFTNSTSANGSRGYKPSGGTGWGGVFYNDLGYTGWFGSASDQRLKTNIKPLSNSIDVIKRLNVYSYQFDIDKYPNLGDSTTHFGVMAQELEVVLPNLVKTKNIDLYNTEPNQKDKDMNYKEPEEVKTVNYLELIPILIQATQEQQKIIEEQQQKIDALNKRLNQLEQEK